MNKFVKNSDLNKTSHFRVAFLESKCNKLFLVLNTGVEQLINRRGTVIKSNFAKKVTSLKVQ